MDQVPFDSRLTRAVIGIRQATYIASTDRVAAARSERPGGTVEPLHRRGRAPILRLLGDGEWLFAIAEDGSAEAWSGGDPMARPLAVQGAAATRVAVLTGGRLGCLEGYRLTAYPAVTGEPVALTASFPTRTVATADVRGWIHLATFGDPE